MTDQAAKQAAQTTPAILIISGLDPGGGAGFIADVRVAEIHGLRAVGVVTALTEQDTRGVRAVNPVPAEVIADQLHAILADIEVSAVKIGMLANESIAVVVASALAAVAPLAVWDPILRPTAGRVRLYDGDPLRAMDVLSDHIGVITPNVPEAESLSQKSITSMDDMRGAAELLRARMGDDGAAVLLKGGHFASAQEAVDVLATRDGIAELGGPWMALDSPVHGTGCALSTAMACHLAFGADLAAAAAAAKKFVAARMLSPQRSGRGAPSVL